MNYYHINKNTLVVLSGPHSAQSTYVKRLTSCGNPELLDLSMFDLVPEVYESLVETQKHGEKQVYTDKVVFPAIPKTAEELQIEVIENIRNMDQAARYAIDKEIHSSAGPMIWEKSKANKPKSTAIKTWVESVWTIYAQRKTELISGTPFSEVFLDFSIVGDIPYYL